MWRVQYRVSDRKRPQPVEVRERRGGGCHATKSVAHNEIPGGRLRDSLKPVNSVIGLGRVGVKVKL